MRIVHVITSLERGGAESTLFEALRVPAMRSRTAAVVVLFGGGALLEPTRGLGVDVHILCPKGARDLPLAPLRLRRILRDLKSTIVVHSWLYHADLIGLLATIMLPRVALVWGLHTTSVQYSAGLFTTRLLRRVLAAASYFGPEALLACAATTAAHHIDLGYASGKMHLVPNGVSPPAGSKTTAREELRRQLQLKSSSLLVGWIGRNHPDKNPEGFLDVVAQTQGPQDVHFLLCGRGLVGPSAVSLRAQIQELGIDRRITLLGQQPNGRRTIQALDVLCLTSDAEAMPLVVLEAMAEGIAVVSTEVGDVPAMLGDPTLIVPKRDMTAMAAIVTRLLRDPLWREEIGSNLASRANTGYALDSMVGRYLHVYDFAAKKMGLAFDPSSTPSSAERSA
jgi:glycosyltransferase involved in cell wall biosynthesis